jgi:hypothetical protein
VAVGAGGAGERPVEVEGCSRGAGVWVRAGVGGAVGTVGAGAGCGRKMCV